MLSCWDQHPEARPTFQQLTSDLDSLLEQAAAEADVSLDIAKYSTIAKKLKQYEGTLALHWICTWHLILRFMCFCRMCSTST